MMFGCVCDSTWEVGFGAGQVQSPEFFGTSCQYRHCPSADDPVTTDKDETDCNGVNGGGTGNLCHVDCANRGVCDYATGACTCEEGWHGIACNVSEVVLHAYDARPLSVTHSSAIKSALAGGTSLPLTDEQRDL